MPEINFMVGGEAGQGVQTIGLVLGKAMARQGLHVFLDQDFESRVRGGHSFSRVRVSDQPVGALADDVDVLIALDRRTIDTHLEEVKKDGVVVHDPENVTEPLPAATSVAIPFEKTAIDISGNKIMANTVAIGACIGIGGYDFEQVLAPVLTEQFGRLGAAVVEANLRAARAGFDLAMRYQRSSVRPPAVHTGNKMMFVDGNSAIAIGAMAAGCKFVSGYPMTPTSSVLEYIADKGRHYNVVMVQPEDEIAAINMIVGAAYAGARAMTATSGGGFCLMVEGLSLAGMTETPLVCVLGQRPGPAIGLPTRTEQGELLFSMFAGHGEFPRAVLTPPTIEQCFNAAVNAFNLAEKYQTPVLILTDQHLASSYQTVTPFDLGKVRIERGDVVPPDVGSSGYKRHQYTDSGISPRAFPAPGGPLVVTDSDEHDEEGHMTELPETRTRMMDKRLRKIVGLSRDVTTPWVLERPGADMVLVGWGSTFGAISEAASLLENDGVHANVLQLPQVWPFPAEAVSAALRKAPRTLTIENNATAQLAMLIRAETGISVDHPILKYDGRPFSPAEIVKAVRQEGSTWSK